jgi:hypothetical protein
MHMKRGWLFLLACGQRLCSLVSVAEQIQD